MATIKDVCVQVQAYVRQLDGIRSAPDMPTEQLSNGLMALCYPASGRGETTGASWLKELHELAVEISVPRVDLERDYAMLEPYVHDVPNLLFKQFGMDKWNHTVDTITNYDYSLQPEEYQPGEVRLALRIVFHGVKVEQALT